MNKTKIEYLTHTWNPLAMLCDPVSPGCQNCWHRRRAKMLAKNPSIPTYQQRAYAGESDPVLITSRINQPQKVKKPARIGVQLMGDLWHKNIDWPMIDQVFEACLKAPWHTYIFLTKRIGFAWYYFKSPVYPEHEIGKRRSEYLKLNPNIWFGTSVENQEMADLRANLLIQIPAAVRFVSVEPMLSEIDISQYLDNPKKGGVWPDYECRIDWVIAGKENGPGARPCPEGAIENLYKQCKAAGAPFFDKRENYSAREFPK